MPPKPEPENSTGPAAAIVIVLAMIILGGLYFWTERGSGSGVQDGSSASLEAITTQSSSDDTSSIEADLYETNVEDLGSDLDNL